MSWSISIPSAPRSDFGVAVEAAVASWRANNETAADEVVEQIHAAAAAAKAIAESGDVGPEGATFNGSLSGHTNPGHVPAPGYANDYVTVSVYQTGVRADEETAAGDQQQAEDAGG